MDKTKVFSVACYCRLSHEDEKSGESVSIETQRKILADFCAEKQYSIYDFYVDDGYTGTNFDRPGFKRMMKDIEKGHVNMVIVKDLSRFGREHILVGQYIERVFPDLGVTFLALGDDVDTSDIDRRQTDRIMMSVRNVFNEMWPAETSDKVRRALEAMANRGEFIGSKAPYGYLKSPKDKHTLIIDEEVAPIIKWIFEMAAYSGYGYNKIAKVLSARKVLTPSAYLAQREGKNFDKDPYDWNLNTVYSLLHNETYIGTVTSFKRRKQSYKSDKEISMPEEKWSRNPNMHEAIISQELWDIAQTRLATRKRTTSSRFVNIFAGFLKCDQCGGTIVIANSGENGAYFSCNTYRKKGKDKCTSHSIRYDCLYETVLSDLRYLTGVYQKDKEGFREALSKKFMGVISDTTDYEKQIAVLKESLERNAIKLNDLYEDRADMLISRDMFRAQAALINSSNERLNAKLAAAQQGVQKTKKNEERVSAFIELLEEHEYISELDTELLGRFINKIVIGNKQREDDGSYHQDVTIYYNFIGNI